MKFEKKRVLLWIVQFGVPIQGPHHFIVQQFNSRDGIAELDSRDDGLHGLV